MASVLIYHHLGLGDHLMCHGIVREYCKQYERVGLFVLPHNYTSVAFMFRDLKNLNLIQGTTVFIEEFIAQNASQVETERYDEVKRIGFTGLDRLSGVSLERQFYEMAGVPVEKKWESFYVDRDYAKEEALYKKLIPVSGSYIFLHEDASRNFTINRRRIRSRYPVISPDPAVTENVFDYCKIIENAAEVHVIDSSFMFLIEFLSYTNPNQKLYIHRYARENPNWKLPLLRKSWRVMTLRDYHRGVLEYLRRKVHTIKAFLLGQPA